MGAVIVYRGRFFWSRKRGPILDGGKEGRATKGDKGRRCVGSEHSMYLVVLLERRRGGVRRAGKEKDSQWDRHHRVRWMLEFHTLETN